MISDAQKHGRPDSPVICDDDFATVEEIAAFLRVPNSWVYERTRRRGIERLPHFKIGKYLRFSRGEVLEWVQRQRRIPLALP